jgi:lysophospholipase L1-like esterase
VKRVFTLALLLLLAACGSGAVPPHAGSSPADGADPVPTSDSNGISSPGQAGAPLLIGRFDVSDSNTPTFSWPNSTIAVKFTGRSLRIALAAVTPGTLTRKQDFYDVWKDGVLDGTLTVDPNIDDYTVAADLPSGEHSVELVKRTESRFSTGRLLGVTADSSKDVLSCDPSSRRIEFVGDSITAGYGAEATNPNDAICQINFGENAGASYAQLVGRALGADITNISWAGVGVLNAVNGTDTAASLFTRTVGTDTTSRWGFGWVPQIVVVNLGTNDTTQAAADPLAFQNAYASLLAQIRQHYPQAHLLCLIGPMLNGQDLANIESGVSAALQARGGDGDTNISMLELLVDDGSRGYGCAQHPVAATQSLMATQVEQEIRRILGW